MNKCGWLLGSIIATIITYFSIYTTQRLIVVWDSLGKRYMTYPELAEIGVGPTFGKIVKWILVVCNLSVVISFMILFTAFLNNLFKDHIADDS